jgi:hypothetical protein
MMEFGMGKLMRIQGVGMRRPRIRSGWLVGAVAFVAVVFVARQYLIVPPSVRDQQQRAKEHATRVKLWEYHGRLARERVTTLTPLTGGTPGDFLAFNHFVTQPRPKDPAQARAYDLAFARNEQKCLDLRDYHRAMAAKWAEAARLRRDPAEVPDDPTPPWHIVVSNKQDATF